MMMTNAVPDLWAVFEYPVVEDYFAVPVIGWDEDGPVVLGRDYRPYVARRFQGFELVSFGADLDGDAVKMESLPWKDPGDQRRNVAHLRKGNVGGSGQ